MALTKNQSTLLRDGRQFDYGVKAGAAIFQGALTEANGNFVQKASKGANKHYTGIALEPANGGSGADGAVKVPTRRQCAAFFKAVAGNVPGLGTMAYVEDDDTVHSDATGRSAAGEVVAVESDGVWVYIE